MRMMKPRLVWFRSVRAGLPPFLSDHLAEQVRTMSRFFDVHVLDALADYDEVCDRLEPDLSLFESGVYVGERQIRNTSAHPEVPKVGFLHADAFDASRAAFIADMERWGVNSFFTTSMSMADYTPEIADRLFVWPNTVEASMYMGLENPKIASVLLTGSRAPHYPWRNAVARAVEDRFTTMKMPHFGWAGERGTDRMARGREYARLLGSAVFVPSCGTMARDLVRKHLEIPAAGACLVTERTPAVEAAGFRDMVNCVFAEADDVVDRLEALLADPALLEQVTAAGTELVFGHHAAEHRDQLLQWYRIVSELGEDTRVEQSWPDGRLLPRRAQASGATGAIAVRGIDRDDVRAGWVAVRHGDVPSARKAFLRALNYYFVPEAAVGMVYASLLAGDPRAAQEWVSRLLVTTFSHYSAPEPDPVFWACQIRVHLCSGDRVAAREAALRFPRLQHTELERMRCAVLAEARANDGRERPWASRPSIAPVPLPSEGEWEAQLKAMTAACGGPSTSSLVSRVLPAPIATALGRARVASLLGRQTSGRLKPAVVQTLRARLAPLKRRLLTDAVSRVVAAILETEPVTSAVLVGTDRWSRVFRAVQEGLARNPSVLAVEAFEAFQAGEPDEGGDRRRESAEVDGRLVYVARSGWSLLAALEPLAKASLVLEASLVVLEGTLEPEGTRAMERLLARGRFTVVLHEPRYSDGCAVLRRAAVSSLERGSQRRSERRSERCSESEWGDGGWQE